MNRWNLLALFGGLGFSVLSGRPDIAAPLVLAAETAYLALLGTHPRFQAAVDAQEAQARRVGQSRSSQQALRQILQALPQAALARFERLRARCLELRQIATDLRHSRSEQPGGALDSLQTAGLDRLLWIFLRLLFTEHSLGKFLEQTSWQRIQADMQATESRLNHLDPQDQSVHAQKIRRTLEDNLQTCRDRLANFQKAQANHELVQLEIERLENKIKSLAELSVNRQEPDFISQQVDQVAGSMLETEKTMNDLQSVVGLAPIDDEVPDLVQTAPVQVIQ